MSSRLLAIILSSCLLLGLIIWFIGTIAQFYTQVYTQIAVSASPLLANLLLFLLIILSVAIGCLLIYYLNRYLNIFLRPRQSAKNETLPVKLPDDKNAVATENLHAIQQQLTKIQDEISRQSLLIKSNEIAANLARGAVQIVVFGTGSAGKTSLVNALMGQVVGQVSAPMGTTEFSTTYSLKLKGIEREILITDTPGILEVGIAGTAREELARQLASQADLILFVVDNDLQKSEYKPLQMLVQIGKRLIVVFNKTDRYIDTDRKIILGNLRDRLQGMLGNMDIVAIAANPQPILLDTGATFQLEPDLMSLIRRISIVLRAEGEDLIADNILLQSQRLGAEARKLIDGQRRRQAEKIVEKFQWLGAGAIAITPLPLVDLLATAAVNAQMVVEIGKIYECHINLEHGKELALSLAKTLASLGIVEGVIKIVSTALQLNIATYLMGKAIQGISAAYLTRIAGKSFIEYFRQDQNWGDGGIAEVVQKQFQLNRRDEFVKAFVKDAIARVVEPLTMKSEIEEKLDNQEIIVADINPNLFTNTNNDDWLIKQPKNDW